MIIVPRYESMAAKTIIQSDTAKPQKVNEFATPRISAPIRRFKRLRRATGKDIYFWTGWLMDSSVVVRDEVKALWYASEVSSILVIF